MVRHSHTSDSVRRSGFLRSGRKAEERRRIELCRSVGRNKRSALRRPFSNSPAAASCTGRSESAAQCAPLGVAYCALRVRGYQASRRLALPRDDLPPEFFEKHPVTAEAEVVSRRLHPPGVLQLCVGMAAVQQLVQICQHRAEVIVIPLPKRRRRQALERFQFRTLGVDTPDDLFKLFRNLHVRCQRLPGSCGGRFQETPGDRRG
jgi:hypothetical protein